MSTATTSGGSSSFALSRLMEERKQWRKDHPFGFFAKPTKKEDGSLDLMKWECGIPGKNGSIWEGGVYKLSIQFSSKYPVDAPKCKFIPPLPHPNIYPSGYICLSLLSDWKPSITLKQLLLGVQQLFDEPNLKSPANGEMYELYRHSISKYQQVVRAFAAKNRPVDII